MLVNEISLEEFARLKRFVLDESLKAGWGRLSEMVKLDCRERDRSSGKLHSVEKETELIEAARLVDGEQGRPELVIRNLDVFFFGDVKRHWFARKGSGYLRHADGRCFHAGEVLEGEEGVFKDSEGYGGVRGHA